ncbi:aspartic proteinase CDR1-like [Melia azedarach]|uniref:Aspartic proteinase CDR1-like n=1 Tax=Melia azedarach TaxID=155640 RepID=A0ACC1YCC5_MELAZ|nr:aspartic proteinase CDR1-like [Melia azedarach]
MAVSGISHSFSRFLCAISFFVLCHSCISFSVAQSGGFSVELIHRDSPKSPLFNPNENRFERIINALRRSFNRAKLINPNLVSPTSAEADIIPEQGEFLMKVSLGTPPVEILAIADTGSDLIWTQCLPCDACYQQDAPLFDPSKSSTYKDLPCSSNQCSSLRRTSCSRGLGGSGSCQYSVSYGDNSHSDGNLALDTITLDSTTGRTVPFPKTIIGCGHDNGGTFNSKAAGIIGLGGGDVSLDSASSSKINFGNNGVVSGPEVVSTPLIPKNPNTFYFLTLEAVSVGNQRIEAEDSSSSGTTEGNIIIDSGTTLTYLPQGFNSRLVRAVSSLVSATPTADPDGFLDLCYNIRSTSGFKFPDITVHFTGADVKLSPVNTFARISEDLVCLLFKGVDGGPAIYGNLMQANFLVGYDTQKGTVSFKPTDCSQQ